MNCTLPAFACFLFAAVGVSTVFCSQIYSAREDVQITQTSVFGDPAEAETLTVTTRAQYNNQQFWETVCNAGDEPKYRTRYSFYQTEQEPPSREAEEYLSLFVGLRMGYEREESGGISDAYRELFEETPPGEENSRIVRLCDYYDYYPISVEYCLEDVSDMYGEEMFREDWYGIKEAQFFTQLQEYFRIPVLEDETIQISIGKSTQGNVVSTGSASTDSDSFAMSCMSAVGNGVCYLVFDAHTFEGRLVDTSLLPDGFGIYQIPYHKEEGDDAGIVFDAIELLCEIDPDETILSLELSEDNSRLLLHTRYGEDYRITGIDCKTGEIVQQATVVEKMLPEDSWMAFYEGEGFFVACAGISQMAVITVADNGDFSLAFTAPIYPDEENPLFSWTTENLAVSYNGEKLAVCGSLTAVYDWSLTPDFFVAVYGKEGMTYFGEYHSSLMSDWERENREPLCRLAEDESIHLSWT